MNLFAFTDSRVYASLRISFGLLSLWSLLSLVPFTAEFFSSEGWLPPQVALLTENMRTWSVFYIGHTPLYTWTVLLMGIAASVTMTVGFYSRTSTWVAFIVVASASVRNHFVFSGEDCLLRNFLFLIAFSQSGNVWAFDSWWAKRKAGVQPAAHTPVSPVWPLRLMQIQIGLLYFTSGLAKQRGTDWLTNVATIRAMLNPVVARFSYEFLSKFAWFFESPVFKMGETITLYWELLFPFLMLQRHLRYAALAFGVIAHTSIFLLFQVHFFSFAMLATYVCLLPSSFTVRALQPAMTIARREWESLFTSAEAEPKDESSQKKAA